MSNLFILIYLCVQESTIITNLQTSDIVFLSHLWIYNIHFVVCTYQYQNDKKTNKNIEISKTLSQCVEGITGSHSRKEQNILS